MSIFVGIDPGLTGAWSAINARGDVLVIHDLPTNLSGGKAAKIKNEISAAGLREEFRLLRDRGEAVIAAVERTTSMPGQGVASMFSMGDTFGCIRAVLACMGIPAEFPSATVWKRTLKLDSDKERSRARALELFPGSAQYLARKKDHNRAEALLLAEWLRRRIS